MKMYLESLTPFHIGNGERYGLMESYVDGNVVKRVDMDSVFSENPQLIQEYLDALEKKNITALRCILKNGKVRYSSYLKSGVNITRMEDTIREQIKDSAGDIPYIPGSSIKGFLRTALIAKYLKDNGWNFEVSKDGKIKRYNIWELMQYGDRDIQIRALLHDWEDVKNNRIQKHIGARFENLVVHVGDLRKNRHDAKYDIFKYLEISDFYPLQYKIFIDRAINYTRGRRGASILLETVEGKFSGEISLSPDIKIALNSKEYPTLQRKLSLLGFDLSTIDDIEMAEAKMISHIQEAIREYIDDIHNFERKQGKILPKPDGANIRLGFGTGALYKTLWIYMVRELPEKLTSTLLKKISRHRTNIYIYPKSYYLLSEKKPMGWGKLSQAQ